MDGIFNGFLSENEVKMELILVSLRSQNRVLFRRGSFRGPLGSLWLPFGSLLPSFGSFWAPFGSLLAPFWLQFRVLFLKSHVKSCFLAPEFAKHLQIPVCNSNEGKFSLAPSQPENAKDGRITEVYKSGHTAPSSGAARTFAIGNFD